MSEDDPMKQDRAQSAKRDDTPARISGDSYTLLILRHGKPRFRKINLPRALVLTIGTAALFFVSLGVFAPNLLFRLRSQSAELQRLDAENRRLWDERNEFEGALAEMGNQLGLVEGQALRLADELGVDAQSLLEPAGGGPEPVNGVEGRFWFEGEVDAIQSRADRLDQSVDHLDGAFQERIRLLAATPSMMPVEGWFSHGFGWRKDPWTAEREFHHGLDIVAEAGTPIRVPAAGVVTRAARWGNYGKCVEVSHGYGYVTRYAHLSDFSVRPGDRVDRGEVLGNVGSTGQSTGPHLHYEVFRDGRRVNPWKYLGQASDS
jgi:murein DD-endopeptidase MepM/ murein hydrolase activator NlpD